MEQSSLDLSLLEDETLWFAENNIPVFCPHKRYAADGTFLYEVTANDLPVVLEKLKALRQKGIVPRQTDGHLKQGAPEKEQPDLLGYVKDYRIGTHKGVPCILMDFRTRLDKVDVVKDRPYCSVEYRPQAKEIRGVARIIKDPALDLGMTIHYSQPKQENSYPFSFEAYMETEPVINPKSGNENPPGTPPIPNEAPSFTPEEEALGDKMYQYMCMKYGLMGKKDYEAANGAGMPGANNTFVPGKDKEKPEDQPEEKDKKKKGKPKEDTQNMASNEQLEQYAARLEAVESELKTERAKRIEAETNADKSECARMVDGLLNQHYELDRNIEIGILQGIEPAKRLDRVKYLKRTCKQKPGANPLVDIVPSNGQFEGGTENYEKENGRVLEDSDAIARLASSKGIDYDTAKEQYYAQKK